MEGWEERESKEVKERGKNQQTSKNKQTNKIFKDKTERDSVLINSKWTGIRETEKGLRKKFKKVKKKSSSSNAVKFQS
jgi:hypothetical protein